jgi:hypothetical protein
VPIVASRSARVVLHHLDGFLRAWGPGLLQPGTGPGVRWVLSASDRPTSEEDTGSHTHASPTRHPPKVFPRRQRSAVTSGHALSVFVARCDTRPLRTSLCTGVATGGRAEPASTPPTTSTHCKQCASMGSGRGTGPRIALRRTLAWAFPPRLIPPPRWTNQHAGAPPNHSDRGCPPPNVDKCAVNTLEAAPRGSSRNAAPPT